MVAERQHLVFSRDQQYCKTRFKEKDVSLAVLTVVFCSGILSILIATGFWVFINPFPITKAGYTPLSSPDASSIYNSFKNKFPPIKTEENTCSKRIIGYYSGTSDSEITINQVSKLTHAIFAFVQLTFDGTLVFRNKNRFMALRNIAKTENSTVKFMFSIGGPGHSQNFSPVVRNQEKKRRFIKSIFSFLEEHKLDGVDIFWKWPHLADKHAYSQFLLELNEILKTRKDYILSILVPPQGIGFASGFKMNEIVENVDFINIFAMDYYGPWASGWGNPTGPISPIYGGSERREQWNVDNTAAIYSCETMRSSKFNIVIPFFARLWNNVGKPIDFPGKEVYRNVTLIDGKAVGEVYMPRRSALQKGYNLSSYNYDDLSETAFIYNSTTKEYLTFEVKRSIAAKLDYVQNMNLGGVWIWQMDMDDESDKLLDTVVFDDGFCSTKKSKEYDCSMF
ncbi:GH18 domain-containing protein [Caenorhabditis elegans]|uniref:GH18 domain-containing protein n=1 Tax=Caenorhabditis elegans TaxID=6239 RepID=Q9XU76_CAEEL|nr:GH18 domain-containing protein [Caenorhabditis elegans]CAB05568.2 GH18 domain-containing protein [Caenorhabditis elegans]|eukprot:NP_506770.2 CHItinase-Like [Caenorhabditis elegans]